MLMDRLALIITIIGALNWGSIGLFQFDIVAWLFGGQDALLSRIVYTVVALAGIWCISLIKLITTRNACVTSSDEADLCLATTFNALIVSA